MPYRIPSGRKALWFGCMSGDEYDASFPIGKPQSRSSGGKLFHLEMGNKKTLHFMLNIAKTCGGYHRGIGENHEKPNDRSELPVCPARAVGRLRIILTKESCCRDATRFIQT